MTYEPLNHMWTQHVEISNNFLVYFNNLGNQNILGVQNVCKYPKFLNIGINKKLKTKNARNHDLIYNGIMRERKNEDI